MKYAVKFYGRKLGAIGVFHNVSLTVDVAEDRTDEETVHDQIINQVYEQYEHVSALRWKRIEEGD